MKAASPSRIAAAVARPSSARIAIVISSIGGRPA
jgi:hypothetical protein